MFLKGETMIINIDPKRIYPHPDNPRKDLGDLSELVESIKANGILQNLTVVPQKPGYCPSCNLYNSVIGKCKEDHDKNGRPPCSKWESNGNFNAVIGHRRLAAAKLAGRKEVPCVISDMDYKQQLATMLLENMQRSDLTVYEQAQGFQMLLDFGESVEKISQQTGFSQATVRRRVKLLDLDKDKFQESVKRGATLEEYAELEKIENIEARNKVLEKIGTPNFKWELNSAIEKEAKAKDKALLIARLETFATQTEETSGLQFIRNFYHYDLNISCVKPADAGSRNYFFLVAEHYIELYAEAADKPEAAETRKQKEERERIERHNALNEVHNRALKLREEFVKNFVPANAHHKQIVSYAVSAVKTEHFLRQEIFKSITGGKTKLSPEKALLAVAYSLKASPYDKPFDYNNRFTGNAKLDKLYDFLKTLGYEMSDEERALHDGTHELYVRDDGEGD